jgi:predicted ATPase
LAEVLAAKFSVPLLKSREITEDILKRDGYSFASGIQIERFLANSGRQNEILRRTIEQQNAAKAFVTDRTVVDLAAYVVCEMHDKDQVAVSRILETCRKNVSVYTHIFVCPWRDVPVADNKRRTLNPWYQFLVHLVEAGLLQEWGCKYAVLQKDGTTERVAEIGTFLGV